MTIRGAARRGLHHIGVDVHRLQPDDDPTAGLPENVRCHYLPFRHVVWSPWSTDPDFLTLWGHVSELTTLTPDRLWTLREVARQAIRNGNVAECGVYRGGSAWMLAGMLGAGRLHLFDSFQGLPEPTPNDQGWSAGHFADTSPDEVSAWLGGLDGRCDIHPGWVPDTFEGLYDLTFDFVHLDLDLYKPTLASLDFFWPRIARGGALVVDDFGFPSCVGVREAVKEFGQRADMRSLYAPTSQLIAFKL